MKVDLCRRSNLQEAIRVAKAEGKRSADRVCDYLRARHPDESIEQISSRVSAESLLCLSAYLRHVEFAETGCSFPYKNGFPSREQLKRLADGTETTTFEKACLVSVRTQLFWAQHFAWHGVEQLGANIAISDLLDDNALMAIAELLWETRRKSIASPIPAERE